MSVQVVKLERPNPRQEEFLKCEKKYVAFGGARGGGKSWATPLRAGDRGAADPRSDQAIEVRVRVWTDPQGVMAVFGPASERTGGSCEDPSWRINGGKNLASRTIEAS